MNPWTTNDGHSGVRLQPYTPRNARLSLTSPAASALSVPATAATAAAATPSAKTAENDDSAATAIRQSVRSAFLSTASSLGLLDDALAMSDLPASLPLAAADIDSSAAAAAATTATALSTFDPSRCSGSSAFDAQEWLNHSSSLLSLLHDHDRLLSSLSEQDSELALHSLESTEREVMDAACMQAQSAQVREMRMHLDAIFAQENEADAPTQKRQRSPSQQQTAHAAARNINPSLQRLLQPLSFTSAAAGGDRYSSAQPAFINVQPELQE